MRAPVPRSAILLILAASAWLGACGDDGGSSGVPRFPEIGLEEAPTVAGSLASERERELGPFLASHWRLPVAPQGPPPDGFSEPEASLDPKICGACHPRQLAEWRGSLHASAWSPGLAGQLIEGPLADPVQVRHCQTCHTPLQEQIPFDATLQPFAGFEPALRGQGVLCGGCHIRAHRRSGPPRRPDSPAIPSPPPHGGFDVRVEYQQSRFCAECHQFFDDAGVNGKPIENTFREWQASPQARAGRQCQDCHMPDREHRWRGIHDPEYVRAAIDIDLIPLGTGPTHAALVVANRDVGHAFPTYVTPRVFLEIHQEDAQGNALPDTRVEGVIARQVDFAEGRELADTRVLPGESVRLDYALTRSAAGIALVARVTVDPDHHYRGTYALLLETLTDPDARAEIKEATRRIANSAYTLAEVRRPLPLEPVDGEP